MSDPSPDPSPINPLPPVVAALFLVMIGIEVVFWLGGRGLIGGPEAIGWRVNALQRFAFSGDILDWMIETGRWPIEHVQRFVSYPFVHGSFTHVLITGVFLLAMGKMVAEVFGQAAMLSIFFVSGIIGALVYGLALNDPTPLFGAFPPVYGLIGAFTYLLWRSLALVGENQSRAFTLIAFLMGAQLLFGLLFGGTGDWVADLAGFATGFAMSIFIAPGGWQALRDRMRRD